MNFKKVVDLKTSLLKISMFGFINERAEFGTYPYEQLKGIHLDLDGVELINSSGVKIWVEWVGFVLSKNPTIEFMFSNCPKVIVEQMNSVKGFLPTNSVVKSFYLPLHCEKCLKTKFIRWILQSDYEKESSLRDLAAKTPKHMCPDCQTLMLPDYLPQKYFKFLSLLQKNKS